MHVTKTAITPLRVLFLLGAKASTSIPLEVATHLKADDLAVTVVAYYASPLSSEVALSVPLVEVGASKLLDFRGWHALYEIIRDYRPQVIHVNHTFVAMLGTLLGRLQNVPVVVVTEHHDHKDLGYRQNLLNAVTLLLTDRVICNSNFTSNSFHWWERVVARDKRVTVYNGVDAERIARSATDSARVRRELGLLDDDFVIGNVGRMVRQKDQETLIRSLALVRHDVPNTKLVIVGGGPLRGDLVALVDQLGLASHVIMVGDVERERVYEILHTLDVFAMTSVTEGFCNAVVEAMVAGRPVVVTNVGALPEVVGGFGWLVPPRSPEALSRVLSEISRMPGGELERSAHAGQKYAEARYRVKSTADEYISNYRDLLLKKRPK